MKKKYLKPEADYLELYAEEELASIEGGISGGFEEGEGEDDWV